MLYIRQRDEKSKDALVLIYDILLRCSFESIHLFFDRNKHLQDVIIILVGSKIDLKERREV
jgi:GTPase SAR1 family protein